MNRALIVVSLAALSLGGCSGEAKAPEGEAAVAPSGAPVVPAKPNPWASDGAGAAVPAAPAPAAAASDKPAAPPVNPWAKAPPPGSVPAAPASEPAK